MAYENPGAAFANTMEEHLFKQQQMKRQAMLDSFNMNKQNEQMAMQREEMAERKEALDEKRAEHAQTIKERERNETVKDVGNMVMGDIPDPDLITRAKEHHVVIPMTVKPPAPMAGTAAMSGTPGAGAPITPQEPPPSIAEPLPEVYRGSRQEMEAAAKTKQREAYINGLPKDSPLRADAEFSENMGRNPVASTVAPPKVAADPAAVHAANRDYDIAHPLPEKPVRDTGAKDARAETQRATAHQRAITEMDKDIAPVQAHLDGLKGLATVLNQHTREADTLIAPMVLKATISGTGSGFRMTRPELEKVVGGRDKWSSLELTLNRWDADKTKPLEITEEQRTELRDLAKEIRKGARKQMDKYEKYRMEVDHADSARDIEVVQSRAKHELFADDDDDASGGLPAVGSTFNGGKVLKVTKSGGK